MPKGIPVATVAINGSANAALLALEMIALKNGEIKDKLIDYRRKMSNEVLQKNQRLQETGGKEYLQQKEGAK
jgi:5-(carboxyamino)imidazole ribonucleotide mutase